ncbi:MAG: MBL fold metallo-hydrolase [Myxococcota bacterium]
MIGRRTALVAAAVSAAVVAAPVVLLGWTFSGGGEVIDGQELPGGARVVQDGYVSAFLLELPEGGAALVDAGNDPEGAAIRAALAQRGLSEGDVVALLLTHGHADHTAACARYPNATVYAASEELPLLAGEVGARSPVGRLFGAHPSPCAAPVGVRDGQVLPIGGVEVTAYLVPGHTRGSTAWLAGGVLFLGDSADATADGRLLGSKWLFSDDTDENARSLRALSDRLARDHADVRALAFAHTGTLGGLGPLTAFAAAP